MTTNASDPSGAPLDAPLGLWDVNGGAWIGNDEGPVTYADPILARVAQTVLEIQFGWPHGTIDIRPMTGFSHRRDDIDPVMHTIDALRVAEGDITDRTARRRFRTGDPNV